MLKILLNEQIDELSTYIDERILSYVRHGQVNKFVSYQQLNLISFDWYDVMDKTNGPAQIIIFFTKDHLFFICEDERCLNHVRELIESSNSQTVYAFFVELLKSDLDNLEELEEHITNVEDDVLTANKRTYSGEIVTFRKELLKLKRYYEQLNQIFEGLTENENGLISEEELRYYRILDNKIDRLFDHVLNLRDYVTQVREAYQAQIDIEQNKLMKIFTVVTSIILPLNLIVGWYGMNIKMPEFNWDYAYPFVAVLCVIVVAFCIFVFKRKKWF